jgi:hypothetical protein
MDLKWWICMSNKWMLREMTYVKQVTHQINMRILLKDANRGVLMMVAALFSESLVSYNTAWRHNWEDLVLVLVILISIHSSIHPSIDTYIIHTYVHNLHYITLIHKFAVAKIWCRSHNAATTKQKQHRNKMTKPQTFGFPFLFWASKIPTPFFSISFMLWVLL